MRKTRIEKFIKNYDTLIVVLATILSLIGIVVIKSAVNSFDNSYKFVLVQLFALILGLLIMHLITILDYEHLSDFSKYIYIFSVFILILVLTPLGTGREETGGQSWFRFGFIGIQPAEIAKIGFIITFSKHLDKVSYEINKFSNVLKLCLHFGVFLFLIELQPDTGTAMVFTFIFISMLFIAGISYKYILSAVFASISLIPILWFFVLKDFQKLRILALINPEKYSQNFGYQVIQSKIAIGSGKLFGNGLFKGTQNQLGILPEKQTDFIFAVIGEELGLLGCLIVIGLILGIILRCLNTAQLAKNNLGRYICIGVCAMFTVQFFENIGMCMGITPVAGVTLPFLSYGGSSLVTNIAALGLVISVRQKSKLISF